MENLFDGLEVSPLNVNLSLEGETDLEVIENMAKQLYKNGYVKESYIEAVKARELVFSTGLPCVDFGVAIPHTDSEHVNKTSIGIAKLAHPVKFKMMGSPDIEIETHMILMLAIKEAHKQLEFLQALMDLFQSEGKLKELSESKTEEEMVEKFKTLIK